MLNGHKLTQNFVKLTLSAVLLGAAFAPAAYADNENKKGRRTGQVVGGILGAVVGSRFGGGNGKTAATAAGAIFGAMIGGEVAENMAEEDEREAASAMDIALRSDYSSSRHNWNGPNFNGYIYFTNHGYYNNTYCREYRNETRGYRGERVVRTGIVCQDNYGRWYEENSYYSNRNVRYESYESYNSRHSRRYSGYEQALERAHHACRLQRDRWSFDQCVNFEMRR